MKLFMLFFMVIFMVMGFAGTVFAQEGTAETGGFMTILTSVGMAILVSVMVFVTKWQKGESFTPRKMIRTLAIGLALGVICAIKAACQVTAENWEVLITANAGIILVLDQALKFVFRLIWKPKAI